MKAKTTRRLTALSTVVALLALTVPSGMADDPKGGGNHSDTQERELQACFGASSDLVDLDGDQLSDRVESCFLGTNPLEPDSDGDGLGDGLDATPLVNGLGVPLDVRIAAIQEIHPGNGCDTNTAWDPYFTAFAYTIPALDHDIRISFAGLTEAAHAHDRADIITGAELIGTKESGTGTVTGGTATFALTPDLTRWDGGLDGISLSLAYGGQAAEHDHHDPIIGGDGNDDFMPFNVPNQNILTLDVSATANLDSEHASDANTAHIHCQTRITITVSFDGLTEEILDTAAAKRNHAGQVVSCALAEMNGCVKNLNWHRAIEEA